MIANSPKPRLIFALTTCAVIGLTGCETSTHFGGYAAPTERGTAIEIGQTSQEVINQLGSPSILDVHPQKNFYYISSEFETSSASKDELVRRAILAIKFDKNDKVSSYRLLSHLDSIEVTPSERQTRSIGASNNLIDQMISRFGVRAPGQASGQTN